MNWVLKFWLCITLLMVAQLGVNRPAYAAEEKRSVAEQLLPFSEGVAGINIDGKWGFIDTAGKQVIDPVYSTVRSYHEGHAAVRLEKKWGLVDKKNKYVINPRFEEGMGDLSEGLIAVKGQESWGYIDVSGKNIIAMQYDEAREFHEGVAAVRIKQKWGYIDTKGRYVIEPRFSDTGSFKNGIAPVKLENSWGYIRKNGKVAVEPQFDTAFEFREELAAVKIDGNWGFINSDGKFTINPQYGGLGNFSEKVAAFNKNGRWGYITKNDKPQIQPGYASATDFSSEGLALVEKDNEFFYINSSGKRTLNVSARKAVSELLPEIELNSYATGPDILEVIGDEAPMGLAAGKKKDLYGYCHDETIAISEPDWMGKLRDDRKYSNLSLPGTHDTVARFCGDSYQAQSLGIMAQLNAGIRAFDIRLKCTKGKFLLGFHRDCYENINFDDILSTMTTFLDKNHKEALFVRIKNEAGTDACDNDTSFQSIFDTYFKRYDRLWINGKKVEDPTLKEVRGKIVVLQDFNSIKGKYYGLDYPTTSCQDDYDLFSNTALWYKWNGGSYGYRHEKGYRVHLYYKGIKNYLKTAAENPGKLICNYLSGSTGSFPYFVASGQSSHGTDAPKLWTGVAGPKKKHDGDYVDYEHRYYGTKAVPQVSIYFNPAFPVYCNEAGGTTPIAS